MGKHWKDTTHIGGIKLDANVSWWWFHFFSFLSLFGEMLQFDEHIFQMGWFNHQLGMARLGYLPFKMHCL